MFAFELLHVMRLRLRREMAQSLRDVVKVTRLLAVTCRNCLFEMFDVVTRRLRTSPTDLTLVCNILDNTFPANPLAA
jgi:hypothetical protein